MITHNLGVVADICDEVNVMYAGQVVEHAQKAELFRHPAHPYTHGLMKAVPRINGDNRGELFTIEGTVPPLRAELPGCRFAERPTENRRGFPTKRRSRINGSANHLPYFFLHKLQKLL